MMRRRLWILPALLLVLVAADTLYWYSAVQQLRVGLANWMAGQRANGWVVSAATPAAGGWPFFATLRLRDVGLRGGDRDIPNGIAWRADQAALRIALLHPVTLQVLTEGTQHLRVGEAPDIPVTVENLSLQLPLHTGEAPASLELHGEKLRVGEGSQLLTVDDLTMHALLQPSAAPGQAALSMSMHTEGVGLPQRQKWALGPRVASLTLDATVNGPLPRVAGLTARATAWRDDGGSLEVRRLEIHWGPLGLNGTATLALDPQLQPMGAGTAQVTGYAETLDALAREGLMSKSAATTAKALLSLLANAPDDGSAPAVDVPLALQYRTLSMRQVPLVRLPELDWPSP